MLKTKRFSDTIENVEDFKEFCDLFFEEVSADDDVGHLPVSHAVEAMGQYLREYKEVPDQPDWRFVARLIYAGTILA